MMRQGTLRPWPPEVRGEAITSCRTAGRYRTRQQIMAARNPRIGAFDDPVLWPLAATLFPDARIVVVPDYRVLPDFAQVDAAVWSLEQAATRARSTPGITAVVPRDLGRRARSAP
jgi:hypothetical protein